MAMSDIEKRLELLAKAQHEYKTKKEMIDDALAQDGELDALQDKVKEARRIFQAAREALMNEPEQRKLAEHLKELAGEIKDIKKLLGDELIAYFMSSKSLEYTDSQGKLHRISVSAKLVADRDAEDR